jgi:hypothetical protein
MATKTTHSRSKRVSKTTNGVRSTTTYSGKGTSNSHSYVSGNTRVTHTRLANGSFRNTTTHNGGENGWSNRSTTTISSPKSKPKKLKVTSYKEKSTRRNSRSSVSGNSGNGVGMTATDPIGFAIMIIFCGLLFAIVAGKIIELAVGIAVIAGIYGLGKWFFRERPVEINNDLPREEGNKLMTFAIVAVILCVSIPFVDMIVRAF